MTPFHPSFAAIIALLLGAAEAFAQASSFAEDVKPFIAQHCLKCHGPEKQSGDLRLDTLDADLVKGKDVERWNDVRLRLVAGEMPPEKEPRPKALETKKVTEWIAAELKKNPKVTLRQPPNFHQPRFGNRVDHDALFHPSPGTVASTPQRVWRLSGPEYATLLTDLRGKDRDFIQPFSIASEGFTEYAALLLADESIATQLIRNAEEVVLFQCTPIVRKGKPPPVKPEKEFIALIGTAKATRPQMESAIRTQFRLVLLRDPTAAELKRFADLMENTIRETGHELGVKTALTAVLLVPEALYRTEFGIGPADAHGRMRLAPRELAFALAYALTDRRTDAALLAAAEQGKLASREAVAEEVKRMLNDAALEKPRILRFFREYFGYDQATEVFKNMEDFRDHAPEMLVADTDRLIQHILDQDKNVLAELLTTEKAFVGTWLGEAKKKPKKAVYLAYNLSDWPAQQPVSLPSGERAGILTQPSWLVAHSENTDNHAIHRGKWIRERLLGGTIPDLPITVNAQLPEDATKTLRQRMQVTQEAYCWQCHQKMNPLGLTFELFDHFGRFRTQELGKPVDSSGQWEEQSFGNGIELVKKLAGTERVRQVFIRHVFRFWLGRNETLDDGPTLVAADKAYVESGGSMKALIVSILTSDSFLFRRR